MSNVAVVQPEVQPEAEGNKHAVEERVVVAEGVPRLTNLHPRWPILMLSLRLMPIKPLSKIVLEVF